MDSRVYRKQKVLTQPTGKKPSTLFIIQINISWQGGIPGAHNEQFPATVTSPASVSSPRLLPTHAAVMT